MSVITATPSLRPGAERRTRRVADAVVSAYIRDISRGSAYNVSGNTQAAPSPGVSSDLVQRREQSSLTLPITDVSAPDERAAAVPNWPPRWLRSPVPAAPKQRRVPLTTRCAPC